MFKTRLATALTLLSGKAFFLLGEIGPSRWMTGASNAATTAGAVDPAPRVLPSNSATARFPPARCSVATNQPEGGTEFTFVFKLSSQRRSSDIRDRWS